jgi:fimbrial chaperone protein
MTVRLFSATLVIGTLLASSVASASGLQVAPTSLDLAANKNADGLWLSNTGDGTLHAQVRVFHWTQEGGEEKLAPSRGLAISPPILQIDAGSRQLVRVIRSSAPPSVDEDAYRVLIDELPVDESQAAAGDASKPAVPQGGLQYVLRYSVPIFVQPTGQAGSVAPKLSGKVVHEGDQTFIEVSNQGTGHAQLGNLVLVDAQGKREELSAGLVGYVLPGQTKRWPLKVSAQALASAASLQSRINSEPVEQTLVLLAPAR